MLSKRYMNSQKNVPSIFNQIIKGTAPSNFNHDHLRSLGFTSSNDRAIIPLLKDLGFLSDGGTPTDRYLSYRDESRSKAVLGEALLHAYEDLFHVSANPTEKDRSAIEGKFKSTHNVTDRVAEQQTATFYALLKLADLAAARTGKAVSTPLLPREEHPHVEEKADGRRHHTALGLRYNVEVHLPATKDIEVYNAIFKSLKEHLID